MNQPESNRHERAAQVFEQWLLACMEGQDEDPEALLAGHEDLRDLLESMLANQSLADSLLADPQPGSA
ncbi:MAG: hypothetical protein QF411_12905, partial [Planctomycetota bacterium]|nr:hypothetical protein [Planctomycetota bacterium]